MSFGLLDVILLVILGGFLFYGIWVGFIQTLGGLVGTIFGAAIAGHFHVAAATWFNGKFGGDLNVEKIVAFIIIFIVADRLIGLIFFLVSRLFRFVNVIPFLSSINRLAGAVMGLIEGGVVLGLAIYIAVRLPFGGWVFSQLQTSEVAKYLIKIGDFTAPLLPEAIRMLQRIIPFI
ncbi:MAG: CvpA family protein [Patescibacteria group bacterium]